ncbi:MULTISPECIES: hypothetical protein [Streptomyces]|nr:hypothetical protein [Streptomyces sp. SID2888]
MTSTDTRAMGRNILIYCGIDWAEKTHDNCIGLRNSPEHAR